MGFGPKGGFERILVSQGPEHEPVPVTPREREHLPREQPCCKVDHPSESSPCYTGRSLTTLPLKYVIPVRWLLTLQFLVQLKCSLE